MVSSKLIGRLGNSMFQIAMSVGYASKYGYRWAVQSQCHNNESSIHRVYPNLPKTNDKGLTFQEHPSRHCEQHNKHFDLCHFDYHEIADKGPDVYFVGFWQSYKYFEHCKESIQNIFKLPHVSGYEDYVSIHVRRGDYVQHAGSFPPIDDRYLMDAIFTMDAYQHKKFIFFSDDIQWCKEYVDRRYTGNKVFDYTFEFDELPTGQGHELKKLSLMASCGHHIIANSTFSWWGAYLGHNPDRIVITPSVKTWFGEQNGVKQPVVDLLPENWVQIDTR